MLGFRGVLRMEEKAPIEQIRELLAETNQAREISILLERKRLRELSEAVSRKVYGEGENGGQEEAKANRKPTSRH